MLKDYFKIAYKNLRQRKLRSWLTIMGIFISIATIFTLISLSLGLQNAVNEQFQILGVDKLFIMPKGQLGAPGTGGAAELTINDVNVAEKLPGVKDVSYAVIANAKVEFNNQARYVFAIGLPVDRLDLFIESTDIKMEEGKFIDKNSDGKAALGYNYKFGNVFSKPANAGDKITINDAPFKILGIVSQIGNPQDDKNVYMPEESVRKLFNTGERIDEIIVRVDSEKNIGEISSKLEEKLRKSRGVTEKTQDFTILTPEELLSSFESILGIITAFLAGIAGISLIVGAVGIANTMYTSVIERTKEIGVMKSVGARNKDILSIFLIESGLLGLMGAAIGIVMGYGMSKAIEYIVVNVYGTALLHISTPFYLVAGCLAFGLVIGSVSGVFPAVQASRTNVVDALRYE